MNVNDDLEKLIENLPIFLQESLNQHANKDKLIEIVLDLGRRPEARFVTGTEYLSQKIISWQDLDYMTKRISKFSNENRAGIERTLHRISCIRNRQFLINGLTCRVGRAVFGTISVVRDLLESEKSILILGKPGVGKTTIIREIARVLADELEKRVIIIDTSNEIAGDSDIPHSGIGRARRMQVAKTEYQHQIMIEAVENHMPQVIIIDEIGTELEVLAARTIAEKGVQLVGTTHGNCLENLIKNPPLSDLIGGIQYVTLSDDEAKRRGTQKSILERKAYPAFEIIIEINHQNSWTIHEDVKNSVDLFLRGYFGLDQIRQFSLVEKIKIKSKKTLNPNSSILTNSTNLIHSGSGFQKSWLLINQETDEKSLKLKSKKLVIYPYSLSSNLLKEVLLKLGFKFVLTNEIRKASLIIGLKKHLKQNFKLTHLAKQKNIPIYSVNQLSFYQLSKLIQFLHS
uniref:ycf45 n=1 Tax=Cocconeiopsis kantsiensis TaxID=3082010 RepID=UPI0030027CF8